MAMSGQFYLCLLRHFHSSSHPLAPAAIHNNPTSTESFPFSPGSHFFFHCSSHIFGRLQAVVSCHVLSRYSDIPGKLVIRMFPTTQYEEALRSKVFLPRLLTSVRRPSSLLCCGCFRVDTSGTVTVTLLVVSCHAVSRLVGDSSRVGFVTSLQRGQQSRRARGGRSGGRGSTAALRSAAAAVGEKAARLLSAVSSRAA